MIKQPPSIIRTELTSPNQANKVPSGKIFMKNLSNNQSSPIQKIKQSQYSNASYNINKSHFKSEEDEELSKSYLNDTRQNLSQSGWNSIQSNINANGKQQIISSQNSFSQNQDFLSKNGKSDFSYSRINALLHEQNTENSYLFRYNSKRNSNIQQIPSKLNSRAHSEDITQNNLITNKDKDESFRMKKQSLHLPKQDPSPQKGNILTENSTYFNGSKSPQKNWKDIEDEIKILKKVLKQNIADISTTNISLNKSQIESNQIQSKQYSQHSPLKESNFLSTKQTLNSQNENIRPQTSLSSQSNLIQQLMQENSNLKREIEKLKISQKVELEEVMNREREEIKIVISQYKQFIDKLLNDKKSLNVNIHQLNIQIQQIQEESRKLKTKNQELQSELEQVKQEYLSLLEEWNDKEERENNLDQNTQNAINLEQDDQSMHQQQQIYYPLNVERIEEESSQNENSQHTNQTRKISSVATQPSQDRAIDAFFGNFQFDNRIEDIRANSRQNTSNDHQSSDNSYQNLRPQSQNQNEVYQNEQNQELNSLQRLLNKGRQSQNQNNYQTQYNHPDLNNNSQRNHKADNDYIQPQQQQQSFNNSNSNNNSFNQRDNVINDDKELERKTSASFKDGLLAHLNEVINNISQEKMKIRDALKNNLTSSSASISQQQNSIQNVTNQQIRNQPNFISLENSKLSQTQPQQINSDKFRNNSSRNSNDYLEQNNQININSQPDIYQHKKPDDDLQQQYESIIQKIKEQQIQKQQNQNNQNVSQYDSFSREDPIQNNQNQQFQPLPLTKIKLNEYNFQNSHEQFSFREYS